MTGRLRGNPLCWQCGRVLSCYTHAFREPRPGDLTVCAYCGALSVFDVSEMLGLMMRRPTEAEALRAEDGAIELARHKAERLFGGERRGSHRGVLT